jgi:dTDP-4-dehydrorhamnose 3,5-epimerase
MNLQIEKLPIPGCFILSTDVQRDGRGAFVKLYQESVFRDAGLETSFQEEYYSVSVDGTIRGLHFQSPPTDHAKIVCCIAGKAFDAIVDLRIGSPAFGKYASLELEEGDGCMVYIAKGCAHGFQALRDGSILHYRVSSEYDPLCDKGVRWDSAGIAWPKAVSAISSRDTGFPCMADFASPFVFARGQVS